MDKEVDGVWVSGFYLGKKRRDEVYALWRYYGGKADYTLRAFMKEAIEKGFDIIEKEIKEAKKKNE